MLFLSQLGDILQTQTNILQFLETGIGNGTIARWGKSFPRVDSLQAVAKYFGCSVDDLLREPGAVQDNLGGKH